MKTSKIPGLGRFGLFIDDVDLNTISDDEWMEIGRLHMQSLVTIIRGTNITPDRQSELLLKFGEPRHGQRVTLTKKYLERYGKDFQWVIEQVKSDSNLIDEDDKKIMRSLANQAVITKTGYMVAKVAGGYDENGLPKGMFAEGELEWHSNESGTLTFCPGIGLLGTEGVVGSATGFVTTTDWYEKQSEGFRSELDEMVILHRYQPGRIAPGVNQVHDDILYTNMCPVADTEVPLVIQSPGGIKGLHYTVPTLWQVKGMSREESLKLFERMNKEIFVGEYIYDHWYKNTGDFLLFDNSITMHRRLGNTDGRMCHRGTFDYTNLQDGPYQPFYQKKYQKQYNKEIREVMKLIGNTTFKLPKRSLTDFVPFL